MIYLVLLFLLLEEFIILTIKILSVRWDRFSFFMFSIFIKKKRCCKVTASNRHKQNSRFCKEIREDNFRFCWRRVHEDASQGMYMSEIEICFLLLEYCKIRECYAVANAFTIRNMYSLLSYMKCKINRPTKNMTKIVTLLHF